MQSLSTQNSTYVHRTREGNARKLQRKEREYEMWELSMTNTVCQTWFFVIFVSSQFRVLKSFNEGQFDQPVGYLTSLTRFPVRSQCPRCSLLDRHRRCRRSASSTLTGSSNIERSNTEERSPILFEKSLISAKLLFTTKKKMI